MEYVRGKIRNPKYAMQLRDMSGLRWGKITPTDIDGFLDFGGRVYVIIEGKHGRASMTLGQRLALERLCDSCTKASVATLLVICSHTTTGTIDYAELPVVMYRCRQEWRTPGRPITVRQIIDEFLRMNKLELS